ISRQVAEFPLACRTGFEKRGVSKRKKPAPVWRRLQLYSATLRGLKIGRSVFAAAAVGLDVEGNLLSLVQRAHAGALDGGDVHEDVGAAGILHDKAVAFLGVEKLDGTCSHDGLLWETPNAFLRPHKPFARSKSGFCVFLGKAFVSRTTFRKTGSCALAETARQAQSRIA